VPPGNGKLPAMAVKTRGYAFRVDVAADASRVWRALVDPESLGSWCSPNARLTARAGGLLRASVDRVTELDAHIDVFDPQRRLRLIYLPSDALPAAESAIVDDLILESEANGTIVRVLGSGFPDSKDWDTQYRRLRAGWERALARLKVFVERQLKQEAG
jgi:uncharacterized protein YndB with AHSA1/START domain